MDYLEFIARATSHIPEKGQVMIRYYGLYSNAPSHFSLIEDDQTYVPSISWAEMIRIFC